MRLDASIVFPHIEALLKKRLRWPPNVIQSKWIGGPMSIIAREKKPKGGGQSPQFKMRIDPALKEQLEAVAKEEGVSLASWLKELAREALRGKGILPRG